MSITVSSSSGSELFKPGPGLPIALSPQIAPSAPPSAPAGYLKANEGAQDYPRVVVVLDPHTRIIECAAGIQWVIQNRRGARWEGISFCRTKEALLRLTGSNHPALTSLPDRFPG